MPVMQRIDSKATFDVYKSSSFGATVHHMRVVSSFIYVYFVYFLRVICQ